MNRVSLLVLLLLLIDPSYSSFRRHSHRRSLSDSQLEPPPSKKVCLDEPPPDSSGQLFFSLGESKPSCVDTDCETNFCCQEQKHCCDPWPFGLSGLKPANADCSLNSECASLNCGLPPSEPTENCEPSEGQPCTFRLGSNLAIHNCDLTRRRLVRRALLLVMSSQWLDELADGPSWDTELQQFFDKPAHRVVDSFERVRGIFGKIRAHLREEKPLDIYCGRIDKPTTPYPTRHDAVSPEWFDCFCSGVVPPFGAFTKTEASDRPTTEHTEDCERFGTSVHLVSIDPRTHSLQLRPHYRCKLPTQREETNNFPTSFEFTFPTSGNGDFGSEKEKVKPKDIFSGSFSESSEPKPTKVKTENSFADFSNWKEPEQTKKAAVLDSGAKKIDDPFSGFESSEKVKLESSFDAFSSFGFEDPSKKTEKEAVKTKKEDSFFGFSGFGEPDLSGQQKKAEKSVFDDFVSKEFVEKESVKGEHEVFSRYFATLEDCQKPENKCKKNHGECMEESAHRSGFDDNETKRVIVICPQFFDELRVALNKHDNFYSKQKPKSAEEAEVELISQRPLAEKLKEEEDEDEEVQLHKGKEKEGGPLSLSSTGRPTWFEMVFTPHLTPFQKEVLITAHSLVHELAHTVDPSVIDVGWSGYGCGVVGAADFLSGQSENATQNADNYACTWSHLARLALDPSSVAEQEKVLKS